MDVQIFSPTSTTTCKMFIGRIQPIKMQIQQFLLSCIILLLLASLYIRYKEQETWWEFDSTGDPEKFIKSVEYVTGQKRVEEFAINSDGEISSAYVVELETKQTPADDFDPIKEKELDSDDFSVLEEQPPEKWPEKHDSTLFVTSGLGSKVADPKAIVTIKGSNTTHWTDTLKM
jgi:hypothetical protein